MTTEPGDVASNPSEADVEVKSNDPFREFVESRWVPSPLVRMIDDEP
jgi:hypothetical protein